MFWILILSLILLIFLFKFNINKKKENFYSDVFVNYDSLKGDYDCSCPNNQYYNTSNKNCTLCPNGKFTTDNGKCIGNESICCSSCPITNDVVQDSIRWDTGRGICVGQCKENYEPNDELGDRNNAGYSENYKNYCYCRKGYKINETDSSCTQCPNNTYSDTVNSTTCTNCNTISDPDNQEYTPGNLNTNNNCARNCKNSELSLEDCNCSEGMYNTGTSCINCTDNAYFNNNTTPPFCTSCEEGTVVNANKDGCIEIQCNPITTTDTTNGDVIKIAHGTVSGTTCDTTPPGGTPTCDNGFVENKDANPVTCTPCSIDNVNWVKKSDVAKWCIGRREDCCRQQTCSLNQYRTSDGRCENCPQLSNPNRTVSSINGVCSASCNKTNKMCENGSCALKSDGTYPTCVNKTCSTGSCFVSLKDGIQLQNDAKVKIQNNTTCDKCEGETNSCSSGEELLNGLTFCCPANMNIHRESEIIDNEVVLNNTYHCCNNNQNLAGNTCVNACPNNKIWDGILQQCVCEIGYEPDPDNEDSCIISSIPPPCTPLSWEHVQPLPLDPEYRIRITSESKPTYLLLSSDKINLSTSETDGTQIQFAPHSHIGNNYFTAFLRYFRNVFFFGENPNITTQTRNYIRICLIPNTNEITIRNQNYDRLYYNGTELEWNKESYSRFKFICRSDRYSTEYINGIPLCHVCPQLELCNGYEGNDRTLCPESISTDNQRSGGIYYFKTPLDVNPKDAGGIKSCRVPCNTEKGYQGNLSDGIHGQWDIPHKFATTIQDQLESSVDENNQQLSVSIGECHSVPEVFFKNWRERSKYIKNRNAIVPGYNKYCNTTLTGGYLNKYNITKIRDAVNYCSSHPECSGIVHTLKKDGTNKIKFTNEYANRIKTPILNNKYKKDTLFLKRSYLTNIGDRYGCSQNLTCKACIKNASNEVFCKTAPAEFYHPTETQMNDKSATHYKVEGPETCKAYFHENDTMSFDNIYGLTGRVLESGPTDWTEFSDDWNNPSNSTTETKRGISAISVSDNAQECNSEKVSLTGYDIIPGISCMDCPESYVKDTLTKCKCPSDTNFDETSKKCVYNEDCEVCIKDNDDASKEMCINGPSELISVNIDNIINNDRATHYKVTGQNCIGYLHEHDYKNIVNEVGLTGVTLESYETDGWVEINTTGLKRRNGISIGLSAISATLKNTPDCGTTEISATGKNIYTGSEESASSSCQECPPGMEKVKFDKCKCNIGLNQDPIRIKEGNSVRIVCKCNDGDYFDPIEGECKTCPAGHKCPDGIDKISCNDENNNLYQPETGQTSCLQCYENVINNINGCSRCKVTFYSNDNQTGNSRIHYTTTKNENDEDIKVLDTIFENTDWQHVGQGNSITNECYDFNDETKSVKINVAPKSECKLDLGQHCLLNSTMRSSSQQGSTFSFTNNTDNATEYNKVLNDFNQISGTTGKVTEGNLSKFKISRRNIV